MEYFQVFALAPRRESAVQRRCCLEAPFVIFAAVSCFGFASPDFVSVIAPCGGYTGVYSPFGDKMTRDDCEILRGFENSVVIRQL